MAEAMTPRDALRALDSLPRYEEALTARTGGLTFMLWGFVNAGIFLTYAAASDWVDAHEAYWLMSVLWMPWVAGGIAASGALWRSHAVTLRRRPGTREGLRRALLFTLLFLVIGGALFFALDVLAGVEWSIHAIMTLASGLFAMILGAWQRRDWGAGSRNIVAAGCAMVAAGLALALSPAGDTVAGLLAAGMVGLGWFLAGVATYVQG
jgi:hypothetical protein